MKIRIIAFDGTEVPEDPIEVHEAAKIIKDNPDARFELQSTILTNTIIDGEPTFDTAMSILIRDHIQFAVVGGPCHDVEGINPSSHGILLDPLEERDGEIVINDKTALTQKELFDRIEQIVPQYIKEANLVAPLIEPDSMVELIVALNRMFNLIPRPEKTNEDS